MSPPTKPPLLLPPPQTLTTPINTPTISDSAQPRAASSQGQLRPSFTCCHCAPSAGEGCGGPLSWRANARHRGEQSFFFAKLLPLPPLPSHQTQRLAESGARRCASAARLQPAQAPMPPGAAGGGGGRALWLSPRSCPSPQGARRVREIPERPGSAPPYIRPLVAPVGCSTWPIHRLL